MDVQIYNAVKDVINTWDPMRFFPAAPPDEYDGEIKLICEKLGEKEWIGEEINELAEFIGNLCDAEDRYYGKEQYIKIAESIISAIKTASCPS